VVGVCTKEFSPLNSDHVDLSLFSKIKEIPWTYSDDVNSHETSSWIRDLRPDVIFCFGWSQMIKQEILEIPRLGVIGFHPSTLPHNRGRHPIIWALILGLEETGSTFFQMDLGADSGDIISQARIRIDSDDNAFTLYEKITDVAKLQLNELLAKLEIGTIEYGKQDASLANYWRKRSIADGLIDWRMSAVTIHNLVRGLSAPYPGAHFLYNGAEIKVWKTEISHISSSNMEPGKVLKVTETGPIIKCGMDAIRLTETEPHFRLTAGEYI
jgi:methionyl-tRNA formyltransferase